MKKAIIISSIAVVLCIIGMASFLLFRQSTEAASPDYRVTQSEIPLHLVSINATVWPGESLNIKIKTEPQSNCKLYFEYLRVTASNPSRENVVKTVLSDKDGIASVSLPIPAEGAISPGYYRLTVNSTAPTGSQATLLTSFFVD